MHRDFLITLYKTNASLRPRRKTVKRETFVEMAGDSDKPLGLFLERKKMIINLIPLCSG
jgi:hypothetical protein